ncbi:MAG: hypothetical protein ABI696_04105 [Rubrivivax sp.]
MPIHLPGGFHPLRAALLALTLVVVHSGAAARTWLVGPGGAPMALSRALAEAADGDTVEVLPGTYKGEGGVIGQKRLTIRGLEPRPVIEGGDRLTEDKAALVVRDGDVTIENLEFRGHRAPDANGAGIRFEKGRLTVRRSRFADNEMGLLTANFGDAELVIEDSEFVQAPHRVGGLPHLLYVGRIASMRITGSRFHGGFEGHLIKSRARRSFIGYNLIVDGPGGGASYEIDLPNGGEAVVIGNIIGQSADTQNPVMIAYGAEGKAWEHNQLLLSHNTFVSDALLAWFLRSWPERLTPDTQIRAVNNLTVGAGIFTFGSAGSFDGNWPALARSLVDPASFAFELDRDAWLRGRADDPATLAGPQAVPTAEFTLPIGTRPLTPPAAWSPGALQR